MVQNDDESRKTYGAIFFLPVLWCVFFSHHHLLPKVPKDTMQNIAICKKRGTIESCPFVSKYCNVDELPTFLGGKCECEGGCIPGLPNHMEEPRTLTQKELEQLKAEKEEGDQQEAENWEKFKAEFNK